MEKFDKIRRILSDIFFWAGMVCELIVSPSGYAFGWYHEKAFILTGMICLSISILLAWEMKKEWKLYTLCAVFGLISYYFQNSALILRIALAVLAGRSRKRDHVVSFFFYGTLAIVLYAGILSLLGVHNSVTLTESFRSEEETRFCFGFFHPNGFSFFVYRIYIMGTYMLRRKFKWRDICFWSLTLFCGILIFLSGSKMGAGALLLTLLMWVLRRFAPEKITNIVTFVLSLVSAIVQMLMVTVFAIFTIPSPNFGVVYNLWDALNLITTGRLWLAAKTFNENQVTAFGMKGVENLTESGFANACLKRGMVFLILYFALLVLFSVRAYKQKKIARQIVFMGSTCYALGESYLSYFNKNPMWLMLVGYETDYGEDGNELKKEDKN